MERPTIRPRTVYSRDEPMQFDGRAQPLHSLEVVAGSVCEPMGTASKTAMDADQCYDEDGGRVANVRGCW